MNKFLGHLTIGIFFILFLTHCNNNEEINQVPEQEVQAESRKANAFFDSCYDASLSRDPELQTSVGIKTDNSKWTDHSDEFAKQEVKIAKDELARLHKEVDIEKLDDQTRVSYHYFEYVAQQIIDNFKWRFYNYAINQVNGFQNTIPAFLINKHQITNIADAKAYIERIKGINALFDREIEGLQVRDSLLILPPKFVFPLVMNDCRNILSGQPFDNSGRRSPLYEDFISKMDAVKNIDGASKTKLISEVKDALVSSVKPAYTKLMAHLAKEAKLETNDFGVWKLPEGKEFYKSMIRKTTTTDISPEQVFGMGESDLKRVHYEIQAIMKKVGFKGKSISGFFNYMLNDNKFYFENSGGGREAYIAEATNVLNTMKNNLDRFFATVPRADIVVRPAEYYHQQLPGYAFYEAPSMDGKKPGICYIRLSNMKDLPIYQIESTVYYEAIPGYHMQVSNAQELKDIPMFRKYGKCLAYDEGWALYAEYFPKEFGFYTDPYSDYGRLATEAVDAASSVIDVGIHYKHWDRQKAIQYLLDNAPYTTNEAQKEVELCLVSPGRATGYKIGMAKIIQLRDRAAKSLGKKFDIRKFHDAVLTNGPLPLSLLEDNLNFWINDQFGK